MKTEDRFRSVLRVWLDPFLLVLLGLFYLAHLYPALWWGDGPELMTAAYRNGVAHPTGYPLYLVLLKFFSFLPLGSLAWKGNLFSMLCTLATCGFLARLVPIESGDFPRAMGWRIGLSAIAFSPLIWEPTLVCEVYSLSVLFMALSLWIGKRFLGRPSLPLLLAVGLVAGLGVGHHRILAFLVPGLALWMAPAFHGDKRRSLWIVPTALVFLLGVFGPYSILYFRAQGTPPINWGDPSSLENLWEVFSAEQFRMDQKVYHLKTWVAYSVGAAPSPWQTSVYNFSLTPARLWGNFGLGMVLATVGFVGLAISNIRILISGAVAWILPTLFIVQYHVGDQETFHLIPYAVVGCLIAYGWAFAVRTVWTKARIALIFVIPFALMQAYGQIDRLQTPPEEVAWTPNRYARRTLNRVPPGGVLFVASDKWDLPADFLYFPILFHHHVEERNQDAAMVAEGYFTSPWYRPTLESQGISGIFFDYLETGNDRVPVYKTDFKSYIRDDLPKLMDPPKDEPKGPEYKIFLVDGRPYFLNRDSLAILVAEYLFPELLERPLYATAKFDVIDPFLKTRIEWKPIGRIPVDISGYPPLRGEPLPSGNIYRVDILDASAAP